MNRQEKAQVIAELADKFSQYDYFYIADTTSMTVEKINALRRLCFNKGIEIKAAKNTLIEKALQQVEGKSFDPKLIQELKQSSTLLFAETSNLPAKVIKEFRGKDGATPAFKVAYIDSAIFAGEAQLDALSNLKSKAELVGDIIGLLQSPASNLISALQSSGGTLAGILKTLSEK